MQWKKGLRALTLLWKMSCGQIVPAGGDLPLNLFRDIFSRKWLGFGGCVVQVSNAQHLRTLLFMPEGLLGLGPDDRGGGKSEW